MLSMCLHHKHFQCKHGGDTLLLVRQLVYYTCTSMEDNMIKLGSYGHENQYSLPLHIRPLGSGSHSPLSVQIAKVELSPRPMSSSPGGHLNLIALPSTGKPL